MTIKVLLADDHRLFREGIKSILLKQKDITIAGETSDGPSTIEASLRLHPDIILMDVSMPVLNGLETSRRILEKQPKIRIIMVSMHSDRRFVIESLRAGAAGYILKESAADELIQAIRSAISQRAVFLSQRLQSDILQDYLQIAGSKTDSAFSILSSREREVLQGLAEGMTVKEIAARFDVSFKTVEAHRKNIMDKLDLHSIAELTKYAIKEGLTKL